MPREGSGTSQESLNRRMRLLLAQSLIPCDPRSQVHGRPLEVEHQLRATRLDTPYCNLTWSELPVPDRSISIATKAGHQGGDQPANITNAEAMLILSHISLSQNMHA
jgi:hypothetical protein